MFTSSEKYLQVNPPNIIPKKKIRQVKGKSKACTNSVILLEDIRRKRTSIATAGLFSTNGGSFLGVIPMW
jgi:hypothetical protein